MKQNLDETVATACFTYNNHRQTVTINIFRYRTSMSWYNDIKTVELLETWKMNWKPPFGFHKSFIRSILLVRRVILHTYDTLPLHIWFPVPGPRYIFTVHVFIYSYSLSFVSTIVLFFSCANLLAKWTVFDGRIHSKICNRFIQWTRGDRKKEKETWYSPRSYVSRAYSMGVL